ncbi:MAG: hypothetical protein K0S09_1666 [Sphingobacteriaceae bacterium]|jgi:hypothetical protein|nr:hypothetical protein [Sphingobacteriaceae bacterium]
MLGKEEFSELAKASFNNSISIYIPTHPAGVEVNEKHDLILFKNALQQSEQQLKGKGLNAEQIKTLLEPAYTLLKDDTFWHELTPGLAVFIADNFFKTIKLPFKVEEELHVNKSFYLRPMVPMVTSTGHFHLLAFSKNWSCFFRGDEFGMQRMEIEGLPQGMEDVIHFEEKSATQTFRGESGQPGHGTVATPHGHGSGLADEKEYIAQYLTEVDQTLMTEVLANERVPLVLAAVDYMVGIYRQVSHYKCIADTAITGNYEHSNLQELYPRALEIAAPVFKERTKKALQSYGNSLATPLTSSMPEKVIPASYFSQISDLFVEKGLHIWGTFNQEQNQLVVHEKKQQGDECLVDRAIVNTLLHGGDVHILEKSEMPNRAEIAAFMRF